MILSHSKKFLFIHVYKTAGTSISTALAPYNMYSIYMLRPYRWISRKYSMFFPNPYPRHARAIDIQKAVPKEVFDSYFKFSSVRNPWDWHLSIYSYTLRKRGHHQAKVLKELGTFEDYVKWLCKRDTITLQKDFLYDENDNKLIDFIGKVENINDDFAKICRQIGIAKVKLPHLNKSNEKRYQEAYSEKTRDLIYKTYKKDIELFEYEF